MDENCTQDDAEEKQVAEPLEMPLLMAGRQFRSYLPGSSRKVSPIDEIEHQQEHADDDGPHGKATLDHPREGDAHEVTQKQGRITDGSQAPADVGHNENEKNYMMTCQAVLIHP